MDDKAKSEARRKKILNNAEARLRFIKEGIPWRNEAVENNEPLSNTNASRGEFPVEGDALPSNAENENSNNQCKIGTKTSIESEVEDLIKFEGKTEVENSQFETNEPTGSSDKTVDSSSNFINHEAGLPHHSEDCQRNHRKDPYSNNLTTRSEKLSTDPADVPLRKPFEIDSRTEDTINNLKSLLMESSNERREQKEKTANRSRLLLTNCFIMLLLGVCVRIAYAIGLAWIFKEAMLAPFLIVAIPQLILSAKEIPPPSGLAAQMLLMYGVKVNIINKAYTTALFLRTALQLFSVYLISFVFTHKIAELFV